MWNVQYGQSIKTLKWKAITVGPIVADVVCNFFSSSWHNCYPMSLPKKLYS